MAQSFKLGLMAEQWMDFETRVLRDAPAEVRKHQKRAFYAGAECILFRVIQAFAPEAEPTEMDVAIMEGVHQELRAFGKLVKDGKA